MTEPTADLYDRLGDSLQSLSLQLRSYGAIAAFSGPVRTIRCFEDNALVKQTLATPGKGAVLVIDGGGSLRTALLGDLIAQSAIANGWAGVVIHGAIRDSAVIRTLPLGVKALGTNPRKSGKTGSGELDVEITIGDVTFQPGSLLTADDDGVLVQ